MWRNNSNKALNRRNLLRSLGVFGTGFGGSALTGTVGATRSNRALDPVSSQSYDERIEAVWDEIIDLVVDLVSSPLPLDSNHPQLDAEERKKAVKALESLSKGTNGDSGSDVETMSVPTALPFDLCYDMAYSKVCVDSNRPQVGVPNCGVYVPEVAYFSFSVNQYSRNITGGWDIDISAENLWLGVDSNGCVWAGEETSATCARLDCPNNMVRYYTDPISDVATSALGNALEAAEDILDDFDGWQYFVAAAIIALALVIAVKYMPVTFFVGGAVIVASKSVGA